MLKHMKKNRGNQMMKLEPIAVSRRLLGSLLACVVMGATSAAWAQDCKVLPFTANLNIDGMASRIDTTDDPDCLNRARKLAFYGKWDINMSADANKARDSEWLIDGEKKAVEMADYMGKNSRVQAGVDLLTSSAKGIDKALNSPANAQDLVKISLALTAKTLEFVRVQMTLADIPQARVETVALVSKSLKLAASIVDCSNKKNYKCAELVKSGLKAARAFEKLFELKPSFADKDRFIDGYVSLLLDAGQIIDNIASPDWSSKFLAAAGMLDATSMVMTGEYWRDKTAIPQAWDQAALIVASAGSIWIVCTGAVDSLVVEQRRFLGIAAECVSRVNDYLNTNLARMMSYTYVLSKASEAIYQSRKIHVARLVLVERLKYPSIDELYAKHGISLAAKDRAARLCEKLALDSGYNYRADLYRVMQLWTWERFGNEVVATVNAYVEAGIRSDAQALNAGTLVAADYAKGSTVRFLLNRINLSLPGTGAWDAMSVREASAKSYGQNRGAQLQALTIDGRVAASSALTPLSNNVDGTSDWFIDLSKASTLKALADGAYQLRTVLTAADGSSAYSPAQALTIKKSGTTSTVTLTSLQTTVTQGGTLTLRANVVGRANVQPTLVIKNASTGATTSGVFAIKVAITPEHEQWQYQQSVAALPPGSYSYYAEITASPAVQSPPGVLTITGANPVTGTVDNAIRLSAKTGETLQLYGKLVGTEVVFVDFYTAANATPTRDRGTVNKAAGTWSLPRSFPVAGNYSYQVRAESPTTKALVDLGGRFALEITDALPPPPPPIAGSISTAQATTTLQVAVPASFRLTGANLTATAPPRISLTGCEAPSLSIVSSTQATFSCRPAVAGSSRLFWKVAGTNPADKENDLGQFTVTGPPNSADGMRYVSDAPMDDKLVDGGERITKTWTLANSGSTTWSTAYCLRPISGAALAAGPVCPSAPVRPGESFAFSTSMLMPAAQASQAMVKQSWTLTNAASAQVGTVVWAQFQVKALPGRNEPPAAINCPVRNMGWTWANSSSLHAPGRGVGGADDSFALDYNRNTPSFDADAGQPVYAVADGTIHQGNGWGGNSVGQILINHTETDGTPWSSGYLHMRSKTTATTVRRGDQIGVVGNVGVPDGNNHLHFAVYRGHNGVASVARTPSCNVASLVDGMQFVSDTPADNQLVGGGARISKSWTLSNSGSSTWSTGYCLRPLSGTPIGWGEICPTAPVAPGQRFTFSTTLAMPAAGPAQAQVKQTWALRNAAGAQVGPEVWAQFQVKAGSVGGGGGITIVEPFAMPAAVRAKTDSWAGAVNLSKAATQVRLVLVDPQGNTSSLPWTQAAATRWTLQHTFNQAGTFRWTLEARDAAGAVDQRTGTVQVSAEAPPAPLTPVLTKVDSVRALVPWSAGLKTAAPVYQANLVFSNGRRIPLYGDQTNWETRNENCVFSEAGSYPYELQLQRSQTDPKIESFPGGTLLVLAQVVPANPPTVTSVPTTEQGQPYNLTVTTAAAADRVAVKWPDTAGEQGLQATNPGRTQWAYGNRLFMQPGAVAFTVRSYKDGFTAATGEFTGSLQVTIPNASMRLVDISNNIVKSERPYFTVAASLAVDKVTVQLGSQPAVTLSALGPNGAEQSHRGQVLAAQAGTVPYVITAFSAQGHAVGAPIRGNVSVVDPTDSLVVPSPVPAEVQRGLVSNWQFRTRDAPAEMWLAVAAPIGNLPLTGYFLNHTFNYPAGDHAYQLMRRDHLGNVFAIQGAAGTLRMREVAAKPSIKAMGANPATVKLGQAINFGVSLSQPVPVQRAEISFLDVSVTEPLSATAADSYGRTHTMTAVGANRPYRMSVVLADGTRLAQDGVYTVQPPDVPPPLLLPVITSVRTLPVVGKVGQQLNFVVTVTNPGSVARVELVFPDANNLTEPMAQQSADTWVRSRPMTQAGVNRPALVRLLLKDGRVVLAGLNYTVQP